MLTEGPAADLLLLIDHFAYSKWIPCCAHAGSQLMTDHVGAFVGRMLCNIWALLGLLGGIYVHLENNLMTLQGLKCMRKLG